MLLLLQIQRTCEAIHQAGCVKLRTFECLLRQYEVQSGQMATDLDAASMAGRSRGNNRKRKSGADAPAPAAAVSQQAMTKPEAVARGHTGYLLVARKAVGLE